ncbi:MAG: phosphatase PAP2 family protein [Clostridia bacterium]|nr:phosphatase PAP2 family protein [Clostridia bacterium]
MELLKYLQQWRMPWLDAVVDALTYLGDEVFFMLAGLLLLWCINKKWGFRLLFIGMLGTSLNQLLKGIFCIPRPWILDPNFQIVESARGGATGYSFPSGHTHSAANVFGTLAMMIRKKWVTALCILLVLVVGFSRMYLGVHTPLDVGVSLLLGLVTVCGMGLLFERAKNDRNTLLVAAGAVVFTALALLYLLFAPKTERNMAEFDAHGIESMGKMLGASIGVLLSWWVDMRYTHFETKAPLWGQIVKVVVGAALVLGVKSGMKPLFVQLLGDNALADGLRYFCIAAAGGVFWPMSFRFFAGRKSKMYDAEEQA